MSSSNVFNQDFNLTDLHFMWFLRTAWEWTATFQEIISLSFKTLIIFKVIISNSLLCLNVLTKVLHLLQYTSYY